MVLLSCEISFVKIYAPCAHCAKLRYAMLLALTAHTTLIAPSCATLRSLRSMRHPMLIALHRATLRFLRYHAPYNVLLRFSMLLCATLRSSNCSSYSTGDKLTVLWIAITTCDGCAVDAVCSI